MRPPVELGVHRAPRCEPVVSLVRSRRAPPVPLIVLPKSCSCRWGPCPPPLSLVWVVCLLSFLRERKRDGNNRLSLMRYISACTCAWILIRFRAQRGRKARALACNDAAEMAEKKERKKTDNPREGWEDGTPPPHRDFLRRHRSKTGPRNLGSGL